MKKNILLAMALAALVSCSSDDFVGDQSLQGANESGAISFSGESSKITRATTNTGDANVMLDNQFKVYGVKTGTSATQKVFVNYGVWFGTSTANTTTSNTRNWEYVEESTSTVDHGSSDNPMSVNNQTIKYWDHSATDYRFVAGSPFKAFTFNLNSTSNAIESATVTGLAGHINPNTTETAISTNPIYIAEPLIIQESGYATGYGTAPVTFNFVRQQARVRVGIYETIPGYKITKIKFYPYGDSDWGTSSSDNIILASKTANYFVGGKNDEVEGSITYNWATTPASYTYTYNAATGKELTQSKNWYAGKLNASTWNMAITSTGNTIEKFYGTDKDMETTTGYFTVLPTPSATTATPLLIKCDYVLSSEVDGSGETIKVSGATAAIPNAFTKWNPNTSYTYLFKISDNTNGSTGGSSVGIYPITFDAVVTAEASGTEQGTITTVTTPSITTYQAGSVTDTGIEYKSGTAITATVTTPVAITGNPAYAAGAVLPIQNTTNNQVGYVQVYYLGTTAQTEADLQITPPSTTGAQAVSVTNNVLSFTPATADIQGTAGTATGYYAIAYLTATGSSNAYTYKVIAVKKAGS